MPEDLIKSIAKTIDDIWDAVIGGRPFERLLNTAEAVAPANVVRKLGLPAPGDLPDKVAQEIENAVKTGTIPRPPMPQELIRKFKG